MKNRRKKMNSKANIKFWKSDSG